MESLANDSATPGLEACSRSRPGSASGVAAGSNPIVGVGDAPESHNSPERQQHDARAAPVLGAETPITYRYLTFDTHLPVPATASTDAGSTVAGADLPTCPDLSSYSDPFGWSPARKNLMLLLSCVATALTAFAAGSYAQAVDPIMAEFDTSQPAAITGVTIFCMGFALAPMVLAPFSEAYGRYPIFAVSGVIFTLFQAVCGVVPGLAGLLVSRFFVGVGGSVFSTMVGGVIADMYPKETRNTPMSLFSGAVLFGTGIGPLIAAVIVNRWQDNGDKWKWVFWVQTIADAVLTIAVILGFSESRGPVLLSRKARKLNAWYEKLEGGGVYGVWMLDGEETSAAEGIAVAGPSDDNEEKAADQQGGRPDGVTLQRIRWLVKEDELRASIPIMIRSALSRPVVFFFVEPIVFFFSLWVSFAWAVLYLMFGSIPLVFERQYGFDTEQAGYVFSAMMIASVVGTAMGLQSDSLLRHPAWQSKADGDGDELAGDVASPSTRDSKFWIFLRRKFPADSPEARLYFTCLTSILLPLGLFLFGFSAQPNIHWIVPTIAVGFATVGILFVYLSTFNYLADTYQTYASSALATQSALRNILGGVFPLVVTPLFTNLGEDAAGGLLGAIAMVLTLVPWVLVFYGDSIRARSKYASVSFDAQRIT